MPRLKKLPNFPEEEAAMFNAINEYIRKCQGGGHHSVDCESSIMDALVKAVQTHRGYFEL